MTPRPRILVACVGNIFFGDDAFGVEVAKQFAGRALPAGVRVVDFGIRGMDLTYALVDQCDVAILVDAVPRGQAPGTLYVIEPPPDLLADVPDVDPLPAVPLMDAHGMDPVKVLRTVAMMGGKLRRILVVGCEPTPFTDEDMQLELSPPVQAAVPRAIELIESLIAKMGTGDAVAVEMPVPPTEKGDVAYAHPFPTP